MLILTDVKKIDKPRYIALVGAQASGTLPTSHW